MATDIDDMNDIDKPGMYYCRFSGRFYKNSCLMMHSRNTNHVFRSHEHHCPSGFVYRYNFSSCEYDLVNLDDDGVIDMSKSNFGDVGFEYGR